jgi:hypothetical protein
MVRLKALDFAEHPKIVSEGETLIADEGRTEEVPEPPEHNEPRNRHDGDA